MGYGWLWLWISLSHKDLWVMVLMATIGTYGCGILIESMVMDTYDVIGYVEVSYFLVKPVKFQFLLIVGINSQSIAESPLNQVL